jgi:SAM-dependent methyltransferase
MNQTIENDFLELMISRKMFSSKKNLQFKLNSLFKNVNLANKNVLDVGGGSGLLSFYAAVKGAQKVVCLEPEFAGSTSGVTNKFYALKKELPTSLPIELNTHTLQDYFQEAGNEIYDVVIMHNSINHLDEEACINLLKSATCYNTYLAIFKNVFRIMKKGGLLIVTDCSCKNFFNDIRVKNVLAPSIEWHKHQIPRTWVKLLKAADFRNSKVKWLTPNRFGKPGIFVLGNPLMAYMTASYFKVTIVK